MLKKLPDGFPTWISFYNYLSAEKPELLKGKTIHFMSYNPNGPATKTYSIQIATVERNCWKEIKDLRLTLNEAYDVMYRLIHAPIASKVSDFLIQTSKFNVYDQINKD